MREKKKLGAEHFIAIVVTLLLLFSWPWLSRSCQITPEQRRASERAELKGGNKIGAWTNAKQFVRRHLKSPSTADFGSAWEQDPRPNMTDHGNGKYTVRGWVDSQNSFGAKVRTNFTLTVRYTGNGNWSLVDGPYFD